MNKEKIVFLNSLTLTKLVMRNKMKYLVQEENVINLIIN